MKKCHFATQLAIFFCSLFERACRRPRSITYRIPSPLPPALRWRFRHSHSAAVVFSFLVLMLIVPTADAGTLSLGDRDITIEIPDSWSYAKYANFHKIYSVSLDEQSTLDSESLKEIVQISVHSYRASDHTVALRRLREIAMEGSVEATFLKIGGWPALQRRRFLQRPQPGTEPAEQEEMVWMLTTAVAVNEMVIRFESWVPPDASDELLATVDGIGASISTSATADPETIEQEILELQADPLKDIPVLPKKTSSMPEASPTLAAPATSEISVADVLGIPASGTTTRIAAGGNPDSELEIAVSDDGLDIVIGSNNGFSFSNDGGGTWGNSAGVGSNDPSVAWGQSGGAMGTFYAANISGTTTGFWNSTDGGANFAGPVAAYTCGQGGDPACGAAFPDQEHIAADRFNVTAGGDQVYSTWRHLDGNWGIVCSTDGGTTWSTNGFFFPGDLPKITVGQDGFVYVVYHPDNDDDIRISKFNSCESNQNPMVQVFDALVVSNPTAVACPTPGLDRCNFRNSLASPTVAVDDIDPSHVYVAYAANTNPGGGGWWPACTDQNVCNEIVVVQDSVDGGATWTPGSADRTVVINSGVTARRFMPWVCTAGGTAYVSWYDRRAANPGGTTVSNNSLTDFYRGSAFLNAVGSLTRGVEMQVNEIGSTDAQCESGAATGTVASWPAPVDASGDSESCSLQPQLGGYCCVPGEIDGSGRCLAPTGASSQNACDFSAGGCPAGEQCAARRGWPKYGDYNGGACAAGRFFMTWASATSPPSIAPASTNIDAFFTSSLVCCEPEIQVPSPVDFGLVCGGATETILVCNTGVENLVIGSIASNSPQFAVTDPLSGFPVSISPDFCFPFEVTFDASLGTQAGILTINSNDPANSALEVPVSATVGEPDINVAIADSGYFGEVCSGDQRDLDFTLFNQGNCDLSITAISIDDPRFVLPGNTTFPLVLSPDADFNLPVRFQPDACGTAPVTGTVTIASDDPDEDPLTVDVSGTSPCPDINVAIANSGEFGKVCKGDHADLPLTLFNQGKCDLTITNIELLPDTGSFELPADLTFPLVLSHDADFTVPIRFTPDECFDEPELRTLRITSDSQGETSLDVQLSGLSPCPNLVLDPAELAGLYAFPATVVDDTGTLGCFTEQLITLRNNGECPLTITNISAAAADFEVTAPTRFPIILPSGEENLEATVRFTPQLDDDPLAPSEVTGLLTVVSDDPNGNSLADLCGESVAQSGVRLLVTDVSSGSPAIVGEVDSIIVQSKGKNRPGPINLQFTDQPASFSTVCGNVINYHVDQETLPSTDTTGSNPTSSFLTKAREGDLQTSESFTLGQCEFREVQLELQASDAGDCLLLAKGEACTTDGECCSGKCKGPQTGKTCK